MIFIVTMTLKPVPKDVYLAQGKAENDYAQRLMDAGTIAQFYVTQDHKNYWIIFSVADEQTLLTTLKGFPFYAYFEYSYHQVIDMVAAVAAGMTDPNLE